VIVTNSEQLIDVICTRIMQETARIARGCQNLNYAKLSRMLKEETKAGYEQLLKDLDEADKAFLHSEPMLNQVLNVGCLEIATKAWKRYQMEGN
jgi:hypothetical protein